MWSRVLVFSVAIIINIDAVFSQRPALGSAINVLRSYGRLAQNMRVFNGNTEGSWIFREPSVSVFTPPEEVFVLFRYAQIVEISYNIHIKYCFHFNDLVKDYFDEFKIAGIDKTSLAFSSDWSKPAIARLFGLNEMFVDERYSYIVLKIIRLRDSGKYLPTDSLNLVETAARKLRSFTISDSAGVERFIAEFGTHYISSVATGDSVYQVFAFTPDQFSHLKYYIPSKTITGLKDYERNDIFSPRRAAHVGKILSASGSRSLETWATANLKGRQTTSAVPQYSSLIGLHGNRTLSTLLDAFLKDSAFLEMKLETLSPAIKDPESRQIIDQYVRRRLNALVPH